MTMIFKIMLMFVPTLLAFTGRVIDREITPPNWWGLHKNPEPPCKVTSGFFMQCRDRSLNPLAEPELCDPRTRVVSFTIPFNSSGFEGQYFIQVLGHDKNIIIHGMDENTFRRETYEPLTWGASEKHEVKISRLTEQLNTYSTLSITGINAKAYTYYTRIITTPYHLGFSFPNALVLLQRERKAVQIRQENFNLLYTRLRCRNVLNYADYSWCRQGVGSCAPAPPLRRILSSNIKK